GIGSHDTYSTLTDSLIPPASPPWVGSNPTGYSQYGSLGQYQITGTIVAPGANTFRIDATDAVKPEGTSGQQPFTFTVSRSGNLSAAATVSYGLTTTLPVSVGANYPSLATASDFAPGTLFSGVLSFAANEVSKTLAFPVLGDTEFERDESFDIVLSNPSSGWKLADSRATGIIQGDENVLGFPVLSAAKSTREGSFNTTLLRWRQVNAASGAFDEWGLDNVSLANGPFGDDFDPEIDFPNWTEISAGFASTAFVGSQQKALFVTGDADRRVVSRPLQPHPGDVLSFRLIFGDGMNGGDNSEGGEDVILEFSTNGGNSWTEIQTFDTEDYTTWT
ncbi:MAG TPA: hypothetical protein VIY86_03785, partial [Pirellulaceae bacterium]